jgi:hypothetical protein
LQTCADRFPSPRLPPPFCGTRPSSLPISFTRSGALAAEDADRGFARRATQGSSGSVRHGATAADFRLPGSPATATHFR